MGFSHYLFILMGVWFFSFFNDKDKFFDDFGYLVICRETGDDKEKLLFYFGLLNFYTNTYDS